MKKISIIMLIAFFLSCSHASDINMLIKKLKDNSSQVVTLDVGGKTIDVKINKTSRNNGTVQIFDSLIRLYDDNEDTYIYSQGYLKLDMLDLDADGVNEMIISGTAFSIDDETGTPVTPSAVVFIYKLDFNHSKLREIYRNSEVEIDLTKS